MQWELFALAGVGWGRDALRRTTQGRGASRSDGFQNSTKSFVSFFELWISVRYFIFDRVWKGCLTCYLTHLGMWVRLATDYGLDGPGIESRWGTRFFAPLQTAPGAHPTSCTMGTGSFPGLKSGRGVMLTPHPLLVPWSRKNRVIPLLPLWAVRPVQGCTLPLPLPLRYVYLSI